MRIYDTVITIMIIQIIVIIIIRVIIIIIIIIIIRYCIPSVYNLMRIDDTVVHSSLLQLRSALNRMDLLSDQGTR